MKSKQQSIGLLIATAIGISVWIVYWLATLLFSAVEVSSFWWWFGYPTMLITSWLLGSHYTYKAWKIGALMMFSNFIVAMALVPGAGNLLPFAILVYAITAVPCALLAHWSSKENKSKVPGSN